MDPRSAQHLKPAEFVARIRANGRAAFEAALATQILLVRIDDPEGDFAVTLEAALEDASTLDGPPSEPVLAYDTVVGSLNDPADALVHAARVARGHFGGADLQRLLSRAFYFAVALRKRPGASNVFSERISLGRSRTNDLVLRHHSVSKFHAWFERNEDDDVSLGGAKSTNPTMVNGVPIARSTRIDLMPGDEIRFGDVSALFATPGIVWDALRASR
jgi:hypothetical protein